MISMIVKSEVEFYETFSMMDSWIRVLQYYYLQVVMGEFLFCQCQKKKKEHEVGMMKRFVEGLFLWLLIWLT